ncbi:hypothetical protein OAQ99_05395 [Candidatus Kapabacteria bacterium]|nr:hypothetical protein [Candidatus Kapabacteria bacterium]
MKKYFFTLLLSITLTSCVVVKYDAQKNEPPKNIVLSPKPLIDMSETIVRSEYGDMVCYLPKNWFFVNLDNDTSSEIFAVAVNPDYTLSAVFSKYKNLPAISKAIKNQSLTELAKESIKLQKQNSPGSVALIGNINNVNIGDLKFSSYQVSTTAGALVSNVSCFYTSFGNAYRFALIPMDIIGKPIPSQKEANTIFESILTTMKY